jgi:hypothetical protein
MNLASFSPLLLDLGPLGATNEVTAQPLYVAQISRTPALNNCPNPCNMLVVPTLNSSVFAFNADTGATIWSRTTASTSGASTTNYFWYDDCGPNGSLPTNVAAGSLPFAGIVSTPVIDASGTPPIMFVTSLCQTSTQQGKQQWWIHELNLYTGYDAVTHQQISGTAAGADNADDLTSGAIPFTAWEVLQRSSLLEVPFSGANPSHMVYVPFGDSVSETDKPYHGWVFGYSASLTQEFAFTTTASGVSNSDKPGCTPTCACSGGSCSPGTYCIIGSYQNAANWCGHGAGIWMSGRGPAASTLNGVSHAYFGVGNGGFQQWQSDRSTLLSPIQNWGSSVLDFTMSTSGFDTSPSQYFTPYGGVALEPPLGNESGGNPVPYTYQGLNQNDFDMAVSGILLFDDLSGVHRLLTIDKAGYGYLMTQANLCGSASGCYPGTAGGQPGFANTDPGNSFPFGASNNLCPDLTAPDQCDRVTSLALFAGGSPPHLYFWPNKETLTGFQLSDNTAQTGSGNLSTGSTLTTVNLATANQVIAGDQIVVTGQPPQTVTTVNSNSTVLTVSPGFSSSVSTSSWRYNGYFINPVHDTHPAGAAVRFPGGSVVATSNGGTGGVVWGLAYVTVGSANEGTLLAYDTSLNLLWCNNSSSYCDNSSTFTPSRFALPTVVNGYVYVPTYGITFTTNPSNASCPSNGSGAWVCSGLLVYSGH